MKENVLKFDGFCTYISRASDLPLITGTYTAEARVAMDMNLVIWLKPESTSPVPFSIRPKD